jgi:hypothetical protein
MATRTKIYFKLKFDQYSGNDLGKSAVLSGNIQSPNQNIQAFGSLGNNRGLAGHQVGNFTLQDLQGIIDRNVADSSRSLRAEYDEKDAKREIESLKRIAELEMKMELNKLELRENELREKQRKLEEKEQRLSAELSELETKREEGLGSVKDYSKAIAGGVLELGKAYLGLDKEEPPKKKGLGDVDQAKKRPSSLMDDDDFTESDSEYDEVQSPNLSNTLASYAKMSEEEKYEFLQNIFPEEETTNSEEDPDPNLKNSITNQETEVEPNNTQDNEEV